MASLHTIFNPKLHPPPPNLKTHKLKLYRTCNIPIKSSSSTSPPHIHNNKFIQKLKGKTIVVKYGGAAMESDSLQGSVIDDLVTLACEGISVVLVHGGGPEISIWLKKLGMKSIFLDGLRVTDKDTMEVVNMVLAGKVSVIDDLVRLACEGISVVLVHGGGPEISIWLKKLGMKSIFLDGLRVTDKDTMEVVNMVLAGKELAVSLGAEKLILLTDVAGILEDKNDPESLVKELDIEGVNKMIDNGKIGGGMIPKVNCCKRSIAQGVNTASIIDGRLPHSLLFEILTDEGAGTMITG